jgi:hypothetical protein
MSPKVLAQDLSGAAASLTRVLMLACGAAGAILFVAAWIGLTVALALWIVALGISLDAALTAVAFAGLAAALALLWLCAHLSRSLAFPATARELRPKRLELV